MRLIVVAVALCVAVLASAQAQPIQDAPTTAPKQDAAALDRGQSGQDRPARAKPRGEDQRIATPRTTGAGYTSPRACSVRARAYSFVTPKGPDQLATPLRRAKPYGRVTTLRQARSGVKTADIRGGEGRRRWWSGGWDGRMEIERQCPPTHHRAHEFLCRATSNRERMG